MLQDIRDKITLPNMVKIG